jgi:hypothetical protein
LGVKSALIGALCACSLAKAAKDFLQLFDTGSRVPWGKRLFGWKPA